MKNTSALFGMVLAGAMTLPVAASPALANVITFETAPFGVQFFGPVTEDGFTYSLLFGALHATSSGIPGQDMEGFAVSRFLQGGVLKIVKADGGNFVFDSLNFAVFASFGGGSQTLDVNGSLGGTSVGTDQYTPFNTNFWNLGLASVLAGKTLSELDIPLNVIHQFEGISSSWEAIDNVVLTPVGTTVPEPSTWALMALGFAGLGFAGWRLRRRSVSIAA
jgi:hypothetical protein